MARSTAAVLCDCTGYYSDRISWDKVQTAVSCFPGMRCAYLDQQFCSEDSQKLFRKKIAERYPEGAADPETVTFIIAACAPQEAVIRKSIESQVKGSYRLHVIKMVELCRENPDKKRATDVLIDLMREIARENPLPPREAQWVTTHPGREAV